MADDTTGTHPRFVEPEYNLESSRLEVKEAAPDPCCTRCTGEWQYEWFTIREGQKVIDVPASFGPNSGLTRILKFSMMVLFNGSLAVKIYQKREIGSFFLAFLTNWSLLFCSLWTIVSFINSCIPLQQPKRPALAVSWWIKFCWLLFPVACVFSLIVTLLYWILDHQPGDALNYIQVFTHAGVMLVWPEGLILNRIPVRWKHSLLSMFLAACYVSWLAIHQMLTNIGNPNNHLYRENVTDDLIYEAVDFEDKPTSSSILVVLVVLVVVPVCYLLLWSFSLYSPPCFFSGFNRRYIVEEKPEGSVNGSGVPTTNVNIYETN